MIRLVIVLMFATGWLLPAQWLHYSTPGIPRHPDGKPNLTAPAPRTADGKPDFSGLWKKTSEKYANNIAADLKPGDVQSWADALYQQRKKDFGKDSMETLCLPDGPVYSTTPFRDSRIIQTPAMVVILNSDLTYRQIFMDGRKLEKDPNPTWMGYAVAHWEGDTLVVESNGFNESTWLDFDGHPHTESLRMTERYRRTDFGHIDLQVTLDDPKAYAKPWTVPIQMELYPDTEMLESVCENEKDRTHMITGAKPKDVTVPVETLARYAGSYEVKDGGRAVIAEVTIEGANLLWNYDGTGNQRMDPVSTTTFSLAGTLVEFLPDTQGHTTRLLIKSVEDEVEGRRRK